MDEQQIRELVGKLFESFPANNTKIIEERRAKAPIKGLDLVIKSCFYRNEALIDNLSFRTVWNENHVREFESRLKKLCPNFGDKYKEKDPLEIALNEVYGHYTFINPKVSPLVHQEASGRVELVSFKSFYEVELSIESFPQPLELVRDIIIPKEALSPYRQEIVGVNNKYTLYTLDELGNNWSLHLKLK